MAVELKRYTSDAILVKPKCVLEAVDFLKSSKEKAKNHKNLPPVIRILALPTLGQKCTDSVLQPFTFDNSQSEHPVQALKPI